MTYCGLMDYLVPPYPKRFPVQKDDSAEIFWITRSGSPGERSGESQSIVRPVTTVDASQGASCNTPAKA